MPAQKYVDKYTLKTLSMEPIGIPPNNSHQHLMHDCDVMDSVVPNLNPINDRKNGNPVITGVQWMTVGILCYVNLINYMDRYTIAGILTEIQGYFSLSDDQGGLLQTAFVLSYMLFAPVFGYLGDRYSRRYIMAFGVLLWSLTTLVGSFMKDYYWFLTFRTLVGIGEASYSTIAPTIISDLFVDDMRSKMLSLFYFAIPVGSGLGYIVGSEMSLLTGSWQWGLRVTPVLGAFAVVLILFVLNDPVRGSAEGVTVHRPTAWKEDIISLMKNKSFMLSTGGFTCVAFVTGALAWWGPHYILLGLQMQPGNENAKLPSVSFKFGLIAMFAGIIGVPLGSLIATRLRPTYPRIDPVLCAIGLLTSAPLIFTAIVVSSSYTTFTYILIFVGQVTLNLNWAIVADILLDYPWNVTCKCVVKPGIFTIYYESITLVFGLVSMAAGIVGVPFGSLVSQFLRRYTKRGDSLICSCSCFISGVFMTVLFLWRDPFKDGGTLCYVLIFFGIVTLNMVWSIVTDIGMYVVAPARRSTAEAFQILFSHAFGDAGSPYLIGLLSEVFKKTLSGAPALVALYSVSSFSGESDVSPDVAFKSFQYALFTTCFVEVLGGLFFLLTTLYIIEDRSRAEEVVTGIDNPGAPTHMYADDPALNCSEANLTQA